MYKFKIVASFYSLNDSITERKSKSIEKIIKRKREELKENGKKMKFSIKAGLRKSSYKRIIKQGKMVMIFPMRKRGSKGAYRESLKYKSTAKVGIKSSPEERSTSQKMLPGFR